MTRFTLALALAIWCAVPFAWPPIAIAEPAAHPVANPAAALSDSEQTSIRADLAQLQQRLDALGADPATNADHWADAHVFVKGLVWALDFGPIAEAKDREMVLRAVRRAKERVDALAGGRHPWTEKQGRVVRGFVSAVDGSTQPYCVIVPAGYDPAQPMRLDVVLHGSRRALGTGELVFMSAFDATADESREPGPAVDYIEVHPLGRLGENAYRFEGETDVEEAIAAVSRNYRIDRARVVLRGSSLGGVGSWQIGLKRPDRFVAVGPTAGPVDTYVFAGSARSHFVPLPALTPWQKALLHEVDAIDYAANAGMVPVVALMGDMDAYFSSHVLMRHAFISEGIPFVELVDHGAGHGVTAKAFQQQLKLLDEYAARPKDAAPKEIRFVTWTLKFSRCHWIDILGLQQHYERAEIHAQMSDDGSVNITQAMNITRLAISPPALGSSAATLTIDGNRVDLPRGAAASDALVFERAYPDRWRCLGGLEKVQLSGKRPGLQGPIDDAFTTRFLCVRGTGKAANRRVADWAEASLNRFADEWRRHYRGYLPVKDDSDVTKEDIRSSNLILFGDPGSNRWIKQVLTQLPLGWTVEEIRLGKDRYPAADHGLQLILPNPLPGGEGRYVAFNSGHTYHDAELRLSYLVFPRLGDWAVIKAGQNSPTARPPTVDESVIQSGFFDEQWTNPAVPE